MPSDSSTWFCLQTEHGAHFELLNPMQARGGLLWGRVDRDDFSRASALAGFGRQGSSPGRSRLGERLSAVTLLSISFLSFMKTN